MIDYEEIKEIKEELNKKRQKGIIQIEETIKMKDFFVLSTDSDPYYCGTKSQIAKAKWFVDIWNQMNLSGKRHIRRIHYYIASLEDPKKHDGKRYFNNKTDWQYLNSAARFARYLDMIPYEDIEDKKNPKAYIHYDSDYQNNDESDFTIYAGDWSAHTTEINFSLNIPDYIDHIEDHTFSHDVPSCDGGGGSAYGYNYSKEDQKYHIEIFIEKSTMNDIIEPIAEKYHINYVTATGQQSITRARETVERIYESNKDGIIFYISDFDPSGDNMPLNTARKIEFFIHKYFPDTGKSIKLYPIALSAEQVLKYNLPSSPFKDEDNSKDKFLKKYKDMGIQGTTELDALEAIYPGKLEELIEEAITPFIDENYEDRLKKSKEEAKEIIQDVIDEEIKNAHSKYEDEIENSITEIQDIYDRHNDEVSHYTGAINDCIDKINELIDEVESYRDEIVEINDKYDQMLRKPNRVLEEIKEEVEQNAEDKIEIPDRPEPEPTEDVDYTWLLETSRSYSEQLKVYKMDKGEEYKLPENFTITYNTQNSDIENF